VQAATGKESQGHPALTPRRRQVLALAAQGFSDREIGVQLGLSARTVQMHRKRVQILLGLNGPQDIARWVRQAGGVREADEAADTLGPEDVEAALAEPAARGSTGRLPSVKALPLPLLVADAEMRLRDASDAACRLLGYDRDELLRLSVPDIVAEQEPAAELYDDYLASGQQSGRISLRHRDGTLLSSGYHAHVLQVNGEPYHVSLLAPNG
jgi:PAS domain S-box-containing protein